MVTRALTYKDEEQIRQLDERSGNNVSQWFIDEDDYSEDYAYGLFTDNGQLIGYCTLGGADDCDGMIKDHPLYDDYSLLLSDVYVKPDYRRRNLGLYMVSSAIKQKLTKEGQTSVFLTLLYDELGRFYEKLGFEWCDETHEYAMVKSYKNI